MWERNDIDEIGSSDMFRNKLVILIVKCENLTPGAANRSSTLRKEWIGARKGDVKDENEWRIG